MTGAGEQKRVVVQRGLWYEEFETGVIYQHRPGRTITEADNVLFTTLTMNTSGWSTRCSRCRRWSACRSRN